MWILGKFFVELEDWSVKWEFLFVRVCLCFVDDVRGSFFIFVIWLLFI